VDVARRCAIATASLLLAALMLLSGLAGKLVVRNAPAAGLCRVSRLSRPVPERPSFTFGNAHIAVSLPRGATFVAVPDGRPGGAFIQSNGWIRTKLGWFTSRGAPHVAGRRVDGTGRRLRADVGPLSSSPAGTFYPSLLYFASFGCWRITATAGGARLTAIVNVVRTGRG
jgi:hypothetical protein